MEPMAANTPPAPTEECPPVPTDREGPNPAGSPISRSLGRAYHRFLKIRGCPMEIARGLAIGLFVGMSPALGFHTLIAVPLAALFKSNKIAAAAGVWISNPVTAPVLYGTTYLVGARLMGLGRHPIGDGVTEGSSLLHMVTKAPEIVWALTVGGVVLGLPLAILGYYLSLSAVRKYRADIQRKLAASKAKLVERRTRSPRKRRKKNRRRN